MTIPEAIQGIVQDPKFDAIVDLFAEQRRNYLELASQSKGTMEQRAINNIAHAAKAEACDELIELMVATATKRAKDKLKSDDGE